jgi:hypothetical protein
MTFKKGKIIGKENTVVFTRAKIHFKWAQGNFLPERKWSLS